MKDVPSEILRLSTNVTNALSAISSKGVSIPAGSKSDSLAGLIEQIATGADVSVVTATAPHVLIGDVFVDSTGTPVTGTMPNNGAVDQTLSTTNTSYSVPAGYTSGGTVRVLVETKSATPTKSAQTITPTSGKVLSSVSVSAIPAAYQDVTGVTTVADHVLDGDFFVDKTGARVEGTMPNNGSVSIVLEKNQTYTIPKGFHPGTGVISRSSGGEVEFTITVNVDSGATVTATKGSLSVSGTSVNGVCVLKVPEPGVWTIRANLNGVQFSETTAEVVTNFPATIIGLLSVSYTGKMTHKDSGLYRYYTITDTGVLTLNRPATLEYWVCGGGGNGYTGRYNSTSTKRAGGGAGGGGYFQTGTNTTDTNFTITIGAAAADSSIVSASENITALKGGNGGQWTGTSSVTAGGDGGAGASGGGGGYGGDNDSENRGLGGVGGGVSTIPFGDSYFTSYPCAGGHGGSRGNSSSSYRGGAGGSNGSSGNQGGWANTGGGDAWASAATGGGTISSTGAKAATYYGSGGAGGCGIENYTAGGNGYQGVCFLRIPLSEFGL